MEKRQKGFRFVPFSRKQRKLLHWWRPGLKTAENGLVIADGAMRSGKTIGCIVGFLLWSQETFSGEAFILAGKTMGALRKNVIQPMIQILEAWGWPYSYIRSGAEMRLEIGDNRYYLYSAGNEASKNALQGLTAAGCYADEAALFPESFLNQMIGRCSVAGARIWMNCNPENPHNLVKKQFIDRREEKGVYYLHFMMDDNLSLSPGIKERYRRIWAPESVFYKRYVLGQWAAAEGVIYPQFAEDPGRYLVDEAWLEENKIIYAAIGVDFGGTRSAHSFTLTGFTKGYRQVVVLDEFYLKKRINPSQLQEAFLDFVRKARKKYKVYEAYCDSAEQTLISGLEYACAEAGVQISIRNAIKGPVNDRISFYNSLMAQDRWKVMSHCVHVTEAFSQAVYDEKRRFEDVRLDDGTVNVDSLDSTEYSTESVQNEILYLNGP